MVISLEDHAFMLKEELSALVQVEDVKEFK